MSIGNKVNSAIKELGDLMLSVNLMDCDDASVPNRAFGSINFIRSVLTEFQERINTIEGKRILAESERDSLLMAIAGTIEGRTLDITEPHEVIQHAVSVIRIMDADIKTNREAEEIPFGAVEQDQEKMQLEQRVSELELQLELKVDENENNEKRIKAIGENCRSLISLIDNACFGPRQLVAIDPALKDSEKTAVILRYPPHGLRIEISAPGETK